MAIDKTVKLQVDVSEALKRLDDLEKQIEGVDDTTKKTEGTAKKLMKGFTGVGLAMKAAGFAVIQKLVDGVTEALMKNQQIADGVQTVFNSIGIVFKMVSDVMVNVFNELNKTTGSFDALGQVATNLLNIAITPLKLAFQGIKLGIQSAMLAWEQSFLGGKGKDLERIEELKTEIAATKQSIIDTGVAAFESGKVVVTNFGEMVGEVSTFVSTVAEETEKVFKDVTVNSILEQGKALTETKKNYELLALQQQRLIEEFDRDAEKQRQLRDDVSLSIEDRIAANERLGNILIEQQAAEEKAINAQIASLQQRIDLEGESAELTNEMFTLNTELLAVQAKVAGFESEQLTNKNALLQEANDLRAAEVDIVANTIGSISGLMKEGSKEAKALAVGQALMSTYNAAAAALAPPPTGAGPIFGPIAAIGAVAAGMKNVQSILATKLPGDDGSTETGPTPAIPQSGGIGGNLIPNMGAITPPETATQPVQAFVVENDISNAQALQEELDIQATL